MSQWVAFCDGACSGNPGPGGWAAIVWNSESDQVWEMGGGDDPTTNNRMEMTALLRTLEFFESQADCSVDELWILSDSSYVIRGIEEWIPKWKAKNWQKSDGEAVANQDLWKKLEAASELVDKLKLVHIMGHSGVSENERVDEIAVSFSKKSSIDVYSGPRLSHPQGIFFHLSGLKISAWTKEIQNKSQKNPKKKSSKAPTGPGTYYVSVVKGEVQTHVQWAECELRVKGTSGARFKKVKNKSEEDSFLAALPREVFKK